MSEVIFPKEIVVLKRRTIPRWGELFLIWDGRTAYAVEPLWLHYKQLSGEVTVTWREGCKPPEGCNV